MALYVQVKGHRYNTVWHIGAPRPTIDVLNVEMIQADGDELEFIVGKCLTIPFIQNLRVQRWYGDWAKFVVGNLIAAHGNHARQADGRGKASCPRGCRRTGRGVHLRVGQQLWERS